jgi:hypothetical protein
MIRVPFSAGSLTVTANSNANLKIPTDHNGTITGVSLLFYNGTALVTNAAYITAAIKSLWLRCSMKTGDAFDIIQQGTTPDKILHRELFYNESRGLVTSPSILEYDPSTSYGKDAEHKAFLNLGCADISTLVLDVAFGANITGINRVEVFYELDEALKANLGAHSRFGWSTITVPATGGVVDIDNLPKGNFRYQAIHIGEVALMTVGKVTLQVNTTGFPMRDVPRVVSDRLLVKSDRAPQDGVYSLDFAKEDHAAYFLPGNMSDFKVKPEFVPGVDAVEVTLPIWWEVIYGAQ